jgi:hypothetical protein
MVLKDAPSAAISDPGAADISGWQRTGLGDAAEFTLLLFAELGANAGIFVWTPPGVVMSTLRYATSSLSVSGV